MFSGNTVLTVVLLFKLIFMAWNYLFFARILELINEHMNIVFLEQVPAIYKNY